MVSRSDRGPRKSEKRGSGFQFNYKPRDAQKLKERSERKGGNFDSIFKSGFDSWRPKEGDNTIRILPPTWDDFEHYGYEVFVHKGIGPDNSTYLCLSKMQDKYCPICAAAKEAKAAGEDEEAKKLKASNAFVMWIINRDEKDETPELFMMSWTMDRDVAALGFNKKSGKILAVDHPEEGYDLTIKRAGSGLKTKYFGLAFDRESSPISDDNDKLDEILKYITDTPVPDTLNYYDATYLEKVLDGTSERKNDDDDDEKEEKSARRGRDDDDNEDDKPRGRRSSREDEEDGGEKEEERGSRRRGRDDETDEYDQPSGRRHKRDDDEEAEENPRARRRRGEDEENDDSGDDNRDRRSSRSSREDEEDGGEKEEERGSRRRGRDDETEKRKPERRRSRDDDDGEEEESRNSRRGR